MGKRITTRGEPDKVYALIQRSKYNTEHKLYTNLSAARTLATRLRKRYSNISGIEIVIVEADVNQWKEVE